MKILVLGPLELRRDGIEVPVRRGRPRRLLLSLLLRQGGAVPPDTLIDQLWGDEPPVNADNALQILVSYLRKAFAGSDVRLDRTATGYRLLVDPDDVDAQVFERLVRACQSTAAEPQEQLRLAEDALALWRGPALSEAADDPFAQGDVVRLEELRLIAHEARFEALLALGRHPDALPDLGKLAREHPFRERFHAQLALALYRSGRQAEALDAIDTARRALVEEMGLDPSPELQELGTKILQQAASLAAPARLVAASDQRPPEPDVVPAAPVPSTIPPIPFSLTSLIGREDQVAAVLRELPLRRLMTLTGPGGAGKSRLAAEVARHIEQDVWWADLGEVTDPEHVPVQVAIATGIQLGAGQEPVDALRSGLADRDGVLVLDTCEHVVATAQALVTALLASCPQLRVMSTSRRPLGVAGELAWPVPPLSLPDPAAASAEAVQRSDAVQLFVERAAAARPGFRVDDSNAADVAAVCLLLDGLPLALELAAGNAGALSPRKIADLVRGRMQLVAATGGGSDRHAGLQATVDWSYGLLSPEEALYLDRLSVFPAAFTVEAAVEVAGAGLGADGLTLLLSLVRHSLVAVAGDDRFRLLDTIRAYATDHLEARPADELRSARGRHARWYAALAAEADRHVRGADQTGWLAELRAADADLRAALRHCFDVPGDARTGAWLVTSLFWFWSFDGRFAEARHWIDAALAAGPHEPDRTAHLLLASSMHAESLGDLAGAQQAGEQAAQLFRDLGDAAGEAESLLHVGTARWALGDAAGAAEVQDRTVELFLMSGNHGGVGLALILRARTALEVQDVAGARERLAKALLHLQRASDAHLTALALEQLSRCHLFQGDLAAAERLAQESHDMFAALGYAEGLLAALNTLGQVAYRRGEHQRAQRLYQEVVVGASRMAHAAAVAEGLELLAETTCARGDTGLAAQLLTGAEQVRLSSDVPRTPLQAERFTHLRGVVQDEAMPVQAHSVEELLALLEGSPVP